MHTGTLSILTRETAASHQHLATADDSEKMTTEVSTTEVTLTLLTPTLNPEKGAIGFDRLRLTLTLHAPPEEAAAGDTTGSATSAIR